MNKLLLEKYLDGLCDDYRMGQCRLYRNDPSYFDCAEKIKKANDDFNHKVVETITKICTTQDEVDGYLKTLELDGQGWTKSDEEFYLTEKMYPIREGISSLNGYIYLIRKELNKNSIFVELERFVGEYYQTLIKMNDLGLTKIERTEIVRELWKKLMDFHRAANLL